MNWVVLDDSTHALTKDLLNSIKEECGGRIAFTDMIFQLIRNSDEKKFLVWLTALKTAHRGGELTPEGKGKIIRLLKGGK